MDNKQRLINKAILAKKLDRPPDMVVVMKQLALSEKKLNPSEMNMLSDAYKGVYEPRRTAIVNLNAFKSRSYDTLTEQQQCLLVSYTENIREESQIICEDMLNILNSLIPGNKRISEENESNVLCIALKADFYRYLAEVTETAYAKQAFTNLALTYYQSACNMSQSTMTDLDPTRLGVILNYCVFLDAILQEPEQACQLAQDTIFDAEEASQYAGPPSEKSIDILDKMKKNLNLWANAMMKNGEDGSSGSTSASGE